jgi:hypothetical protein
MCAKLALPVCLKEDVVLQFKKTRLLFTMLLSLSSFGFAQAVNSGLDANPSTTAICGAPSYNCARNDLIQTNNLNPPPGVTQGQNSMVTPSDFGLPIVRITDSTNFNNRSMTASISGSAGDNMFNIDDTYLIVSDGMSWRYPVAFNPSTMQVVNSGPWRIGTNQVRWGGSGSFSRTDRSVVYAVPGANTNIQGVNGNGTTLYKLTLSGTTSISATGAKVFDFAKCPGMPSPYDLGRGVWRSALTVSAGDQRFSQAFSNRAGGQNTATDVTVYDAPSGQCYRYDTAHARLCTASGCVPMSLPDTFTVHEVYMSLDGNYLRVSVSKCVSGSCKLGNSHPYFWQIGTSNVVRCYSSSHTANCTGHMVEGYSHLYNAIGWPEMGKRAFSDPLSYTLINSTPDLNPLTDSHLSNNAANAADTNPIWVTNVQNVRRTFGGAGCNRTGNIYEGCIFPGPLYGEIFGITQSGNYIRAAHTYNSGSSSSFNCGSTIGTVSQTGRFFVWTSDWLTTLGKDDTNQNRCDVFVVNLGAAKGATH